MLFDQWWKENQQRIMEGLKQDPRRVLEECWNMSAVFGDLSLSPDQSSQLLLALREIVATVTDGNTCRYIAKEALRKIGLPDAWRMPGGAPTGKPCIKCYWDGTSDPLNLNLCDECFEALKSQ